MTATRIIIADDHTLFVHGLQLLLKDEQWIKIIDVANDGKELLDILSHTKTDIVLLDINMPKKDGYETANWIRHNHPSVKILALSMYDNENYIIRMLKNGERG